MHIVIQFLTAVESNPGLRAEMETADGDLQQIVAIAAAAGYETLAEETAAVANGASPRAYAHPIVYFQDGTAYAHPQVHLDSSPASA